MENCIFCKIAQKEMSSERVYETEKVVAFRDVSPVAPTHILVIPKKHIQSLAHMEQQERWELLPEIYEAIEQLAQQEGLIETGYRVVTNTGKEGGQTVEHLHFHLLAGRTMQWPPG